MIAAPQVAHWDKWRIRRSPVHGGFDVLFHGRFVRSVLSFDAAADYRAQMAQWEVEGDR